MKAKTKKIFWVKVQTALENGDTKMLFLDRAGRLCWWTGKPGEICRPLPDDLLNLCPTEMLSQARLAAEQKAREAEARSLAYATELRAASEALDKRLDEPGFTLLAGERTDIVHSGTLRECRDNLWKVTHYPRDRTAGIGCWVIVDSKSPDHREVESGKYNRDGLI